MAINEPRMEVEYNPDAPDNIRSEMKPYTEGVETTKRPLLNWYQKGILKETGADKDPSKLLELYDEGKIKVTSGPEGGPDGGPVRSMAQFAGAVLNGKMYITEDSYTSFRLKEALANRTDEKYMNHPDTKRSSEQETARAEIARDKAAERMMREERSDLADLLAKGANIDTVSFMRRTNIPAEKYAETHKNLQMRDDGEVEERVREQLSQAENAPDPEVDPRVQAYIDKGYSQEKSQLQVQVDTAKAKLLNEEPDLVRDAEDLQNLAEEEVIKQLKDEGLTEEEAKERLY